MSINEWEVARQRHQHPNLGTYVILRVADITSTRQAELALHAALEASRAGTFRWDFRSNELWWDDELDGLFGLTPGESVHSLEHFLARVHPKYKSPVAAIVTAFVITVAVTLGLGLGYDPVTAFVMVATALVIVIVAVYILMNAACIGFFARRGSGFNPLLHLIIPILGILAFVPAWLTAAGIDVFSFIAPLKPPISYMGPGVAGFMIIGVIYLIYLYQHDPQRVTEVGLVHLDPLEEYPSE